MTDMGALDRAIFYWIYRWPESMRGFWVFFSEATKDKTFRWVLAGIVILLCASGKTTRKATLLGLVAWPLADAFTGTLKNGIDFARPCVELPDVVTRVGKLTTWGTASSHAANMAAIAFVFAYHTHWRGGIPWVIIAILTGLSRVYVGVHYPSQVLLGWICGALVGLIVVKTWEAIVRLRTPAETPVAAEE